MKANCANHQDAWEDPRYFCGVNEYLKAQMPGKPKEECITIWGYTESERNDKSFWDKLFKRFYPPYNFKIKKHKYSGCAELINLAKNNYLHACKIICIDSDHKYLLDDELLQNKYVFHTYSHSIENHFCYEKNLQYYCDMVSTLTFDYDYNFDFNAFLSEYSKIIYDNFVCTVCRCIKMNECSPLRDEEKQQYLYFASIVANLSREYDKKLKEIKNLYKANEDKKWNEIKKYATDFAKELKDRIIKSFKSNFNFIRSCESCDRSNRKDIESKLNKKKATHERVYLFVRGHTLYDHGLQQLVRLIVKILKNIKESQIYNEPQSDKKGFYNHYNAYNPHDNIFPQGLNCDCDLVDNIKDDIKNFINDPINQNVWFQRKNNNYSS